MKDDTKIHNRHSIRLKGYDYSAAGAYHIVVRTKNGVCVFGEVQESRTKLSKFGEIVEKC